MRKVVLVPLMNLATRQCDSFLELFVEPAAMPGADCFGTMERGALKGSVAHARSALKRLPKSQYPARVWTATPDLALATSMGTVLALVLSAFILNPDFPYPRYMITGTLEIPERFELPVRIGDSGSLYEKMDTLPKILGYQIEPLLLIVPPHDFGAEKNMQIYKALTQNNIAVRTVGTLHEAYAVCDGRLPQS